MAIIKTLNGNTLQSERHIVTIGDSYGDAQDQGEGLWPVLISARLGMTLHNYCQGGAGYVKKGAYTPNRNFLDELDAAAADSSFDNDGVSLVVIYGGYNDYATSQSVTTFAQNARTLFSNAIETFPNALVTVFGMNTGLYCMYMDSYDSYLSAIKEAAIECGVQFVNASYWNAGQQALYKSDNLHPTEQGSKYIANNMLAAISGIARNSTLGAASSTSDPFWRKSSSLSELKAIFTPTSVPSTFSVSFDFTIGTAGGYAWNFNIVTLSYIRAIPFGLVAPVWKVTKDNSNQTCYEYYGTVFRYNNFVSVKFINTIAAGDRFVTGPLVFTNDTDTYTF